MPNASHHGEPTSRNVEKDGAPRGLTIPGLPPLGSVALGAAVVCMVSGVVVLSGYEPAQPHLSTLVLETTRPYGWFFRALHAWSAHLFLISLLLHTIDYLIRRADRQTTLSTWAILLSSLPITLYLMLGGRAMAADAEGKGVAAIMRGLLGLAPWWGDTIADWFVGPVGAEAHVLMTHHVTTATLVLLAMTVFHIHRLAPDLVSLAIALGLSGLVALVHRPFLSPVEYDLPLRGPWYMGGLRWMLERLPPWFAGAAVPLTFFALLVLLPIFSGRRLLVLRITLTVLFAAYAVLTVVAELT